MLTLCSFTRDNRTITLAVSPQGLQLTVSMDCEVLTAGVRTPSVREKSICLTGHNRTVSGVANLLAQGQKALVAEHVYHDRQMLLSAYTGRDEHIKSLWVQIHLGWDFERGGNWVTGEGPTIVNLHMAEDQGGSVSAHLTKSELRTLMLAIQNYYSEQLAHPVLRYKFLA